MDKESDIDEISHWYKVLNSIPKEEGDAILKVLDWDDDTRVAFRIAKRMYDENFISKEVDFYTGEWKIPEGIPYKCPDPIRSYKAKLRIIDDSV